LYKLEEEYERQKEEVVQLEQEMIKNQKERMMKLFEKEGIVIVLIMVS
jgi:hypothetical protein